MPSQAKLFAAPASYLEIASDQAAFQSWLELEVSEVEGADDAALTLEEMAERLERIAATEQEMDRKRARWVARSKDKEEQTTAHLNVRMLAQRAARENSPIIFNALQAAGESLKPAQQRAARCFRCGTDVRYIATGKCVECQRRANADKWHKASEKEYRDRNRDTINERAREDRRKRNEEINNVGHLSRLPPVRPTSGLLVTNASPKDSASSAGGPGPVSATSMLTRSSSERASRLTSPPWPAASIAFRVRFNTAARTLDGSVSSSSGSFPRCERSVTLACWHEGWTRRATSSRSCLRSQSSGGRRSTRPRERSAPPGLGHRQLPEGDAQALFPPRPGIASRSWTLMRAPVIEFLS